MTNKKPAAENHIEDNESVGKIRDILFGNNITEFEKRFQQLENNLIKESEKLSDSFSNQHEELRSEISGKLNEVEKNRKKFVADNQQVQNELTEKIQQNRISIQSLGEELNNELQELKELQNKQINQLKKQIEDLGRSLQNLVTEESQKLRIEKVDRKTLALLLSDLAVQLNEDGTD
ncbi:MAG: hypothetical protein ACK5M7_07920 [Draconibacterium sp.]